MYFDQYFRKVVVCLCARVYVHFAFSPSGLWISKKFCWGLLCVISGMNLYDFDSIWDRAGVGPAKNRR